MPSNIILECSQFESGSSTNAEFASTFKENVILEEGDVFQMQQAMINTQTASSGAILIEEDVDVTISVGFYECALGSYRFGETTSSDGHRGDYNLPLPYSQIPVGVHPKHSSDEAYPNAGFSAAQIHYNSLFNKPTDGDLTPAYSQSINAFHYPAGYYILRERAHNSSNQRIPNSPVVTRDVTISIKAGSYTPTKIASMITDAVTETKDTSIGGDKDGMLIRVTGNGSIQEEKFVRVGGGYLRGNNQVEMPYYSIKSDAAVQGDRVIGASTFSFEFKDGVFAFTNMHSPVMGEGAGSNNGQIYTLPSLLLLLPNSTLTDANKFDVIDAYTGCFITDLQPRSFWNKLGFADTHIDANIKFDDSVFQSLGSGGFSDTPQFDYFNQHRVHPRIINADLVTPTRVGAYWVRRNWIATRMSRDYNGSANPGLLYNLPFSDNNYQLFQSDDSFTLTGNTSYIVNDFAYYRVEAETVFSNDYKQEGGRLGQVIACVSTVYDNNDFVTGFGSDCGVAYYHTGAAQVISAVKIRIINPKTNQPVVGLGPNSTIFLEVVKAPPQPNKLKGKKK